MIKPLVRPAEERDCGTILILLHELARFEGLLDRLSVTEAELRDCGFGPDPKFRCLLAESGDEGDVLGMLTYFETFTTFAGQTDLFIQDLFVKPEARRLGVGRLLMARLAAIARKEGYGRVSLAVLPWNPARAFYERLGLSHNTDWLTYQITGKPLTELAARDLD